MAHRTKSLLFGLATFSLPMVAGTLAGLAFGYGAVSAILVGSLLASHTLIALMMASVALGSTFAEALELDGILGAFLAGLAVNEAVRGTPAKEKIEFLGNIFFISRSSVLGRSEKSAD